MNLLTLVKQSLSIIETATAKDTEIQMWIDAGLEDLSRQGIAYNEDNALTVSAVVMFVKANFGNVEIKEKELAQKTYVLLCNNLSLSYKESDNA